MSYWFVTDCKLEEQLRTVVNIYHKTSSLPTFLSDSQSTSDAKGNDFCLVVVIFNSQKSVNISYLLCYVSIFVYFEIFTSFCRLFSEISSVFKSWITRAYLIQTALCAHKKKRAKLPCMKNYVHFDFMFFPHEFLLNRATLTYLNLVLKLHQLMQSSLRSPWKVNDGRKRSRRRQCHCFWNPKIRGKTSKKFCKVFKLTN